MIFWWNFWNCLKIFDKYFLIVLIGNLLLYLNSIGPDFFSVHYTLKKRIELVALINEAEDLIEELYHYGPKSWDWQVINGLIHGVLLLKFLNFYLTTNFDLWYLMLVCLMFEYIFHKAKFFWYKWCIGSIWAKRKLVQDKSRIKLGLRERLSLTFVWLWVKFFKDL
jgi:hypothetical protein